MSRTCHKLAAFLAAICLFSCKQTQEVALPAPPEGTWPCFNGCNIVLQGGCYGLVSDTGQEILPAAYDGIEFLDNDIALLSQAGTFSLTTRQGRILRTGETEARPWLIWSYKLIMWTWSTTTTPAFSAKSPVSMQ